MTETRCAWCGQELAGSPRTATFCCSLCQRRHEEWSRDRNLVRAAAVSRWRGGHAPNDEQRVGERVGIPPDHSHSAGA